MQLPPFFNKKEEEASKHTGEILNEMRANAKSIQTIGLLISSIQSKPKSEWSLLAPPEKDLSFCNFRLSKKTSTPSNFITSTFVIGLPKRSEHVHTYVLYINNAYNIYMYTM